MKTIKVMANPYCAIDAQGVPQGVCGVPGARGVWIGAMLDQGATALTGKSRFYFPRNRDGGHRVVELDVTNSIVRGAIASALREGSILPADADAAAVAGLDFTSASPDELLLAAGVVAEARLTTQGQDVELKPIPDLPASVDQDALLPKVTGTKVALTPTLTLDTGKDS